MEGYTYLFLQTLPIVSAVAVIFCLMGIYFGASKYRLQLKEAQGAREQLLREMDETKKELQKIKKANTGKAKEIAATTAPGEAADLGEIFESPPESTDDLKKVRGIASVMEQKLNAAGIYTYAQIAGWSDEAATEFGVRLGIIGNVDRYNWREQCARLQREKYGR